MSIQTAEVQQKSGSGSGSGHASISPPSHPAPATMAPALTACCSIPYSDRPVGRGATVTAGKMVPTLDVTAKLTLLIMLLIAVIDHSEAREGFAVLFFDATPSAARHHIVSHLSVSSGNYPIGVTPYEAEL
uniref:Uncharacterized protein n=1 Tax=Anopheles culicifacies TaxID=139723 RepID=A0A182M4P7_9DIPT